MIFKKSVKVNSSLHLLKMPLLLVKLFSLKSIIQIQFLEWVSLLKTVLFLTMKADHMISSLIIVQIELQHRLITLIKECVSYCVGSTRGQNFSSKKCSKINFGPELKQDSELIRTFFWTTNGPPKFYE